MVIYRAADPRKAQAGMRARPTKEIKKKRERERGREKRKKKKRERGRRKKKGSVAYVWRGSPPFLIESRLGAYILSSIGAVGGVSAAKRVETATGGCRKGVQKGVPVRGVSALRIEWGLFANANFKITNF